MARVIRHGSGVVAVYNEAVVLKTLATVGYDAKTASHFANDGCWEVQIPGRTRFAYYPRDLYAVYQNEALCMDGRAVVEYPDFEAFYAAYHRGMQGLVEWFQAAADSFIANEMPVVALIALFEDSCIENARDYECGGPDYSVCSLHVGGIPDIANSMLAVRKLVFEEKRLSLAELVEILKNNWEGHEDLRQYVRGAYSYYGNDCDEADLLVRRIIHDYCTEMAKVKKRCGVIRTAGISTFGRQVDWKDTRFAHAHGFRRGDILAGNISPTPSTDVNGATAIIRSCCKADYTELLGGTTLDLRLEARYRARDRSAARNAAESLLDAGFRTQILRADTQARQMAAESADILGDRHIVVVEHHEQRLPRCPGAAQRLIRHAAGQCTVADDRDNVVFLVFKRACMRHAERHRNPCKPFC